MKWLVAGGCSWEAAAITTRRIPTLTELSRRYPGLKPLLLASLAVHLYPSLPAHLYRRAA